MDFLKFILIFFGVILSIANVFAFAILLSLHICAEVDGYKNKLLSVYGYIIEKYKEAPLNKAGFIVLSPLLMLIFLPSIILSSILFTTFYPIVKGFKLLFVKKIR